MTARQTIHNWELADGLAVEDLGGDAIGVALSHDHATLWYGSHCFEFTKSVDEHGECLLRLEEVGRSVATGSGPTVMLFVEHGYLKEQRLALCRAIFVDHVDEPDIDALLLRVTGRALLADAARIMDVEERFA